MPKLINKTNVKWVGAELELLADSRFKPYSKILYLRLLSLAQSCENIFPSYRWLAANTGVELEDENGEEKSERAINKFIARYLAELQNGGLIKQVSRGEGLGFDYEVYSYEPKVNPAQKSTGSLPTEGQGYPAQKRAVSKKNIEIEEIDKRESASTPHPLLSSKDNSLFQEFKSNPLYALKLAEMAMTTELADELAPFVFQALKDLSVHKPNFTNFVKYLNTENKMRISKLEKAKTTESVSKMYYEKPPVESSTSYEPVTNSEVVELTQAEDESEESFEARVREAKAQGKQVKTFLNRATQNQNKKRMAEMIKNQLKGKVINGHPNFRGLQTPSDFMREATRPMTVQNKAGFQRMGSKPTEEEIKAEMERNRNAMLQKTLTA